MQRNFTNDQLCLYENVNGLQVKVQQYQLGLPFHNKGTTLEETNVDCRDFLIC